MLFRPNEKATVEEIAARVPKDRKQAALEGESDQLRKAWSELHERRRELIAQYIPTTTDGGQLSRAIEKQLNEIETKLRQTQEQQRAVAQQLAPFREEHGARLAAELLPRQQELAGRALDALADLSAIWSELECLAVTVEASGAAAMRVPPLALGLIERRLLELSDELPCGH